MEDKREDIILSIRGMSKSFGRNRVLDHINLDVKRGTVMGLWEKMEPGIVNNDEVSFWYIPER